MGSCFTGYGHTNHNADGQLPIRFTPGGRKCHRLHQFYDFLSDSVWHFLQCHQCRQSSTDEQGSLARGYQIPPNLYTQFSDQPLGPFASSTIILFFLSQESVSVVLQTGNYTLSDARLTALVLRPYLFFMVFSAWYALMLRLGYSANRHALMTRIVFLQNLLDIVLMWVFLKFGLDIVSLPLANGLAYTIGLALLIFLLRDLYALPKDLLFLKGIVRIVCANLPLFIVCMFYHSLDLTWYREGSSFKNLLYLVLIGFVALGILLLSYKVARIPLLSLLRSKKKSGNLKGDDLVQFD